MITRRTISTQAALPSLRTLVILSMLMALAVLVLTPRAVPGQTPGVERAPDHRILLKSRTFSPEPGLSPELVDSGGRLQHVIIQFHDIPDDRQVSALETQGVHLLDYIPNYAYYAGVSAGGIPSLETNPAVRAVVPIRPDDRLAPYLRERGIGDWVRREEGTADLIVIHFEDVPRDEVREVVSRYGGVIDEPPRSNIWTIRIDDTRLLDLAAEDVFSWIQNDHPPLEEHLDQARGVIGADVVQAAPYNLDGGGVTVAEWDGGWVDQNHDDLTGRVTIGDAGSSSANHATHVGGIMAGNGALSGGTYRGVATAAHIRSYEWPDDITELDNETTNAQTHGAILSQNSWAFNIGGYYPCEMHGDYDAWSIRYDEIVNGALGQEMVLVCSAGNEENDGDCPPYPWHQLSPPMSTAKNSICVGAIYSDTYGHTCFSSRGPTDDGRLKPDLSAPGDEANDVPGSPCLTNDMIHSTIVGDAYGDMGGTSMSAPMVSGAVALMREEFTNLGWGRVPPHTYRALLVQAADDLGNPGPDYTYGHGVLDIPEAVDLIRLNVASGEIVRIGQIADDETDIYSMSVSPNRQHLRVTLAWDDPPGTAGAAVELVDNLDVYLRDPSGTYHFAWELDPVNPANNATTGWNDLDNVEVVEVATPEPGLWQVYVWGYIIPYGVEEYTLVTPYDLVECGDVLTEDTYLEHDIACTGDGLLIGADGICLDCQGHTISGDLGSGDYGITIENRSDVTIRNCEITGFGRGISMTNAEDCTIGDNNNIHGNTSGIYLEVGSDYNLISSNWIHDNTERGIEIYDSWATFVGPSNTLENNKRSLVIADGCAHGDVVENDFVDNEFYGILIGGGPSIVGHRIAWNTFSNNQYGVRFWDTGSSNIMEFNQFDGNDCGIYMNLVSGDSLYYNEVMSSTAYGIQLTSSATDIYLQGNTFCSNPVDIYNQGAANTGNENRCTNTTNWADDGQPSDCDWDCSGCRYPEDDLTVTASTTFCPGTYTIPDLNDRGIIILGEDGLVLDGGGVHLIGDGDGEAIRGYGRDNNTIRNFRLEDYNIGISFTQSADGNLFEDNTAEGAEYGFRAWNSASNTYRRNTATGNVYGIWLGASNGHELYDNVFCENTTDIYVDGTAVGDSNRCDTAEGYADQGQAEGCDSLCTETRVAGSQIAEAAPAEFFLGPAVPNPFNPVTEIGYGVPAGAAVSRVTMKIYDATGREVTTLVDAEHGAGTFRVIWDGTDRHGHAVASGVYFYRAVWNGKSDTRRMILLK